MRTRLLTTSALVLTTLALNLSVIHETKAVSWVTTGSMATNRQTHTATLLPNGKVLVAGVRHMGNVNL
jgi:hypothetical protein